MNRLWRADAASIAHPFRDFMLVALEHEVSLRRNVETARRLAATLSVFSPMSGLGGEGGNLLTYEKQKRARVVS